MASILWARAVKACGRAPSSSTTARSFSAQRYQATPKVTVHCQLRCESTNAARVSEDSPAPSISTSSDPEPLPFSSLGKRISYPTFKAITVKPFKLTDMSPVQAEVLPLLPELIQPPSEKSAAEDHTRDLLVKARTGTGKTLAFLIPAVEARLNAIDAFAKQAAIDAGNPDDKHIKARAVKIFTREHVGALIISPTRELATQIANEAVRLTHHHDGFEVRLFVGGMSKRMQLRDWMKGRRDIVVTTPGRLRDFLMSEPEVVKGISKTQMLILDEADTLLDMGFRDEIEAIKEFLPPTPQRQTFLFSATVSKAIQHIARATLDKNHRFINCVSDTTSPVHAHVPQYHTVLPSAGHQIPHILRLLAHDQLANPGCSKSIVFLPTTKMTQMFATLIREMSRKSLPAGKNTKVYEIHSKRTQDARTMTSEAFRKDNGGASILITSDVSARGVDYPGVSRVIQVGIPGGPEQYVHRIGRTGRAGLTGRGDLVLLPWEIGFVTWQLTKVPLRPLTVNELNSQVDELAKKCDEDPEKFLENVKKLPTYDRRGRHTGVSPSLIQAPVQPALADMENDLRELLDKLDEEAVKETFTSLLGFYMGKSAEVRVSKNVIVEGIKDWSTQAMGLVTPPYVSALFLHKLGLTDGRTKRFGEPRGTQRPQMRQNRWDGRGTQRSKDREGSTLNNRQRFEDDSGRRDSYDGGRSQGWGDRGFGQQDSSFGSRNDSGSRGYERRDNDRGGYRPPQFNRRDGGNSGYGTRR